MGRRLEGWDVRTKEGRWWVITEPTNLYSQKLFPSLDYTISFHVGWRRWEQAAETLEEADEAEEFQSVGMRLPRGSHCDG